MKFDSTKIEGFSEMSAEEKVQALLDFEIEVPKTDESEETKRLKLALSKANSEAKKKKKALREKEAERKEHEQEVENELRTLRRDKTVSGYIAQCLALGYTQDLALKAAEAMADGNAAEIMNCQQEFLEVKQRELEAAALNKQPTLTSGSPPTAKVAEAEAYNKMRKAWGLPPMKTI